MAGIHLQMFKVTCNECGKSATLTASCELTEQAAEKWVDEGHECVRESV
jgi:hypothetical protein